MSKIHDAASRIAAQVQRGADINEATAEEMRDEIGTASAEQAQLWLTAMRFALTQRGMDFSVGRENC